MRQILIAGNWKMNGSMQSIIELVEGIKAGDAGAAKLAVCPPAIYMMKVGGMLAGSQGFAWLAKRLRSTFRCLYG